MSITWLLIANASRACLYETRKPRLFAANGSDSDCIKLLETYSHMESRMKTSELVSDKVGNFRGSGSYTEMTNPKEHEAENFARELAGALDRGRIEGKFVDLVIIATPHFSGLIQQHMADPLAKMVSRAVDKDYTHMKGRQLIQVLKEHL